MASHDNLINPEKELERINESIRRYEIISRTAVDPYQQRRVTRILKQLREYRNKIMLLFNFTDNEAFDTEPEYEEISPGFLSKIIETDDQENISDLEIHNLNLYMDFFYNEFLSIFSERKLKLDFKYSIERDGTHHRFMEIKRRVSDFENELIHFNDGFINKEMEMNVKMRNIKHKRTLCIEAHKFFKWVGEFASILIADIETDGLKCLNGDDIISFELKFEKHYCEGLTVKQALEELMKFTDEVIAYLNIPELEI
jgi:hypothetical protein